MAVLRNSKAVRIEDGEVTFLQGGEFTIRSVGHHVQIHQKGGQTTNIRPQEITGFDFGTSGATLTIDAASLVGLTVKGDGTLNITGLTFTPAGPGGGFEPNVNLDHILKAMIEEHGVTGTLERLTVNGNEADAFKLLWDHLDDLYTSYYITEVNDAFIDLGIAYADYLRDGGAAIMDIGKYAADTTDDADLLPDRNQTLHDNLLGNLNEAAIVDRFSGTQEAEVLQRVIDAGYGDFLGVLGNFADGRPYYGGYDHENPTPTREFDDAFFFN